MARVPADATAFAQRDARVLFALITSFQDPAEAPIHEAWTQEYFEAIAAKGTGVYSNFLAAEGEARIREAFPGSTYERLAEVKRPLRPDEPVQAQPEHRPGAAGREAALREPVGPFQFRPRPARRAGPSHVRTYHASMPNRLANETSPYLLQHAHNPVDWYPWGPEALERAKREDKPIFLSIGYAACHWCHVMERESFEDAADGRGPEPGLRRDQGRSRGAAGPRPGLHGGRPGDDRQRRLADERVPDARRPARSTAAPTSRRSRRHGLPVVPPGARGRRPGVARASASRSSASAGADGRRRSSSSRRSRPGPGPRPRASCSTRRPPRSSASSTPRNGGWGGAPKFPQPMTIEYLLRRAAATGDRAPLADRAADARRDGRRRDPRPARRRLPPLRDRRDLAGPALRADALRQRPARPGLRPRLAGRPATSATARWRTGRSTTCSASYDRDDGTFAASQDADTDGEEGATFVWSADEVREVLGDDAPAVLAPRTA